MLLPWLKSDPKTKDLLNPTEIWRLLVEIAQYRETRAVLLLQIEFVSSGETGEYDEPRREFYELEIGTLAKVFNPNKGAHFILGDKIGRGTALNKGHPSA